MKLSIFISCIFFLIFVDAFSQKVNTRVTQITESYKTQANVDAVDLNFSINKESSKGGLKEQSIDNSIANFLKFLEQNNINNKKITTQLIDPNLCNLYYKNMDMVNVTKNEYDLIKKYIENNSFFTELTIQFKHINYERSEKIFLEALKSTYNSAKVKLEKNLKAFSEKPYNLVSINPQVFFSENKIFLGNERQYLSNNSDYVTENNEFIKDVSYDIIYSFSLDPIHDTLFSNPYIGLIGIGNIEIPFEEYSVNFSFTPNKLDYTNLEASMKKNTADLEAKLIKEGAIAKSIKKSNVNSSETDKFIEKSDVDDQMKYYKLEAKNAHIDQIFNLLANNEEISDLVVSPKPLKINPATKLSKHNEALTKLQPSIQKIAQKIKETINLKSVKFHRAQELNFFSSDEDNNISRMDNTAAAVVDSAAAGHSMPNVVHNYNQSNGYAKFMSYYSSVMYQYSFD
ncbi:MAG: hypothetical protein MUE53_03815 [Chitinophagales bacterium]|nr:hypothetical protein [Chitinophagales bacterium]